MSLIERLDKHEKRLLARVERTRRLIKSGYFDDAESDRLWLESFTKGKRGLDICAGDILSGEDSLGVDPDQDKIGVDFLVEGDNLSFAGSGEYDYIISNYFDAFPSPLKTLNEWHRAVKLDGVVAFICCNSKKYTNEMGPLNNKKRLNCQTEETIKFYLARAGFTNVKVSESAQMLRCSANR